MSGRDRTRECYRPGGMKKNRGLPDITELVANGRFVKRTLPNGREVIRVEKVLPVEIRDVDLNATDDGKARVTVTVSDESLDRYGDVIEVNGWDFSNYLRNPVWLVDHTYLVESIIGVGQNPRIVDNRVVLENLIDPAGSGDSTDLVRAKIATGSLRAVSVGFLPYEWTKILDDEEEWTGGYRFTSQDLLEVSWVAVPANPNAGRGVQESEEEEEETTTEKSDLDDVQEDPTSSSSDEVEGLGGLSVALGDLWAAIRRRTK